MHIPFNSNQFAFLFFISSCVSSFCLSILIYTFATGNLPFGITPILGDSQISGGHSASSVHAQDTITYSENFAVEIYNELMAGKDQVEQERLALKDKEEFLKAVAENNQRLQKELHAREEKLRRYLTELEEKEVDTIKRLTRIIAEMPVATGAEMLTEVDARPSTHIVYAMNPETASEIMTAMMAANEPEKKHRAILITDSLQKVTNTFLAK